MTRWVFAVLFAAACSGTGLDNGGSNGTSNGAPHGGGSGNGSGGGSSGGSGNGSSGGSGGGSSGVADGGLLDAEPTPVAGSFMCGTQTCAPSQVCYQDCNDAPFCMDVPKDTYDICAGVFNPTSSMACTTGGSCNPNTRMIMCNCPQ